MKTEKRFDILTIADSCVDLIVSGSDIVPEFNQKEKLVDAYNLEMGGSCLIFACQSAKLGLKTSIIGKVGQDSFGDLILKNLNDSTVNLDYMTRSDSEKTGITIHLNTGSDRAMLTYNGTLDSITKKDIPEKILSQVRHFHIGSYFLMKKIQGSYPDIIQKLKNYGATISLDTNWDPSEQWASGLDDILPNVDIFFPNEKEVLAISRESNLAKAVDKLSIIIPVLVVKRGKEGAECYFKGKKCSAPSLDIQVVDTIGSGDSFDAGFLYGYLNNRDLPTCVKMGCICGSLKAQSIGGTKGQPHLDDLLKYLK
jgi:sugar/nucleoside kinase (ribokinase family)